MSYNRSTSIALCYHLRHNLDKISHTPDGFVKWTDLKKMDEKFDNVTPEILTTIVSEDKKNRYTLKTVSDELWIRCNQGHSKGDIHPELIFEKVTEPIDNVYHGTYKKHRASIEKEGLKKMSRHYIHFAIGDDAKSGMRGDSNLKVYIDMKSMLDDGITIWKSTNDVILIDCTIHPKYLSFKNV